MRKGWAEIVWQFCGKGFAIRSSEVGLYPWAKQARLIWRRAAENRVMPRLIQNRRNAAPERSFHVRFLREAQ